MEENNRIILNGVSKKFMIGFQNNNSALSRVVSLFSGKEPKKEIWAVKDVDLSVKIGENLGIMGSNGSGKSTLLRIIAGVYKADEGSVKTKGNTIYLNGFNNGLNYKLTMKENIYLMGSVMGISQKDIKKRFNEIVEFSGLKDFVYTKVYQFSSGMTTRLSFSATVHFIKQSNPDILLLDDVFGAGGDFDFEEKALKKMEDFISGGSTVIVCSHDLKIIQKYCNKAVCLEKGKIIKSGKPDEVVEFYLKTNE